jgi:hypothetical protein
MPKPEKQRFINFKINIIFIKSHNCIYLLGSKTYKLDYMKIQISTCQKNPEQCQETHDSDKLE